jgi:hypothetical protein
MLSCKNCMSISDVKRRLGQKDFPSAVGLVSAAEDAVGDKFGVTYSAVPFDAFVCNHVFKKLYEKYSNEFTKKGEKVFRMPESKTGMTLARLQEIRKSVNNEKIAQAREKLEEAQALVEAARVEAAREPEEVQKLKLKVTVLEVEVQKLENVERDSKLAPYGISVSDSKSGNIENESYLDCMDCKFSDMGTETEGGQSVNESFSEFIIDACKAIGIDETIAREYSVKFIDLKRELDLLPKKLTYVSLFSNIDIDEKKQELECVNKSLSELDSVSDSIAYNKLSREKSFLVDQISHFESLDRLLTSGPYFAPIKDGDIDDKTKLERLKGASGGSWDEKSDFIRQWRVLVTDIEGLSSSVSDLKTIRVYMNNLEHEAVRNWKVQCNKLIEEMISKSLKEKVFTRESEQLGSNPGGFFKLNGSPEASSYYVKYLPVDEGSDNNKRLANEMIAQRLYRLFKLKTPNSTLVKGVSLGEGADDIGGELKVDDSGGHSALFIDKVDGLVAFKDLGDAEKPQAYKKAREGFLVDVLLANFDVVGADFDNLFFDRSTGDVVRIDQGGALRYRATGDRNECFNAEMPLLSKEVFGPLFEGPEILEELAKFSSVSDRKIEACIDSVPGIEEPEELKRVLLARKDKLIEELLDAYVLPKVDAKLSELPQLEVEEEKPEKIAEEIVEGHLFGGQKSILMPDSKLKKRQQELYKSKYVFKSEDYKFIELEEGSGRYFISGKIAITNHGVTDIRFNNQEKVAVCSSNNGDLFMGCGYAVAKAVINVCGPGIQKELYDKYGIQKVMGEPTKVRKIDGEGRGHSITCGSYDMNKTHGISQTEVMTVPMSSRAGVLNMYEEAFANSRDLDYIIVPMAGMTHPVLNGNPGLNAELAMTAFEKFLKKNPRSKLKVIFSIYKDPEAEVLYEKRVKEGSMLHDSEIKGMDLLCDPHKSRCEDLINNLNYVLGHDSKGDPREIITRVASMFLKPTDGEETEVEYSEEQFDQRMQLFRDYLKEMGVTDEDDESACFSQEDIEYVISNVLRTKCPEGFVKSGSANDISRLWKEDFRSCLQDKSQEYAEKYISSLRQELGLDHPDDKLRETLYTVLVSFVSIKEPQESDKDKFKNLLNNLELLDKTFLLKVLNDNLISILGEIIGSGDSDYSDPPKTWASSADFFIGEILKLNIPISEVLDNFFCALLGNIDEGLRMDEAVLSGNMIFKILLNFIKLKPDGSKDSYFVNSLKRLEIEELTVKDLRKLKEDIGSYNAESEDKIDETELLTAILENLIQFKVLEGSNEPYIQKFVDFFGVEVTNLAKKRLAVIKIQSAVRVQSARKEVRELLHNKNAITIQSIVRFYQAKQKLAIKQKENSVRLRKQESCCVMQ